MMDPDEDPYYPSDFESDGNIDPRTMVIILGILPVLLLVWHFLIQPNLDFIKNFWWPILVGIIFMGYLLFKEYQKRSNRHRYYVSVTTEFGDTQDMTISANSMEEAIIRLCPWISGEGKAWDLTTQEEAKIFSIKNGKIVSIE